MYQFQNNIFIFRFRKAGLKPFSIYNSASVVPTDDSKTQINLYYAIINYLPLTSYIFSE